MRYTITKMVLGAVVVSIFGTWGVVKLLMIAVRNDAERKQHERELLAKEVVKLLRDQQEPPHAE